MRRDLEMLRQRWQGFHEPPPAKTEPSLRRHAPNQDARLQHMMAGGPPPQQSVAQHEGIRPQQHPGMHSHTDISPTARLGAGSRGETGLQGRPMSAETWAASMLSPLSEFSPADASPMEVYVHPAPLAGRILPGSVQQGPSQLGPSQHVHCSPDQELLSKPPR